VSIDDFAERSKQRDTRHVLRANQKPRGGPYRLLPRRGTDHCHRRVLHRRPFGSLDHGHTGILRCVRAGFVTYSNAAKIESLGVAPPILEQFGAVSAEAARAMAEAPSPIPRPAWHFRSPNRGPAVAHLKSLSASCILAWRAGRRHHRCRETLR